MWKSVLSSHRKNGAMKILLLGNATGIKISSATRRSIYDARQRQRRLQQQTWP
jgi:hypothetical protein